MAWEDHQVQQFLCSQFLALIESQATYKYVVYDGVLEDLVDALLVGAIRLQAVPIDSS